MASKSAPDEVSFQQLTEGVLSAFRSCKTLAQQRERIDEASDSDPSILDLDMYSQESFLLDILHLLKMEFSPSVTESVSRSLVEKYDHVALLNASFGCIKEIGSTTAASSVAAKHNAETSKAFEHETTTLQVASSNIRRLVFDQKECLWDVGIGVTGGDRLFSLLLSMPSYISRAYEKVNIGMPQNFVPELFQKNLISATMDHSVFPVVARLMLRRSRGRAIGPGLSNAQDRLVTIGKRLQPNLSDREKALFVRCIMEFDMDNNTTEEGLSRALCCPFICSSLEECCRKIILSNEVPQNSARSKKLSALFAELAKIASGNEIEAERDDILELQEELDRIDESDYILWRALIEISSVWSSKVFVRQTDHTCQAVATSFILRALDLVSTNPIPIVSMVPNNLMNGVSARLSSTHKSIRFDGMLVGERLAKALGEEVTFDELRAAPTPSNTTVDFNDLSAEDRNEEHNPREDDDSSEGSVNFQTFDLEDDQEDLLDVPRPLYLNECLSYFRSHESEGNALLRVEVALRSVGTIVRSRPADLKDHCPELARILLHLENKTNMDDFEEISAEALCSLVVAEPLLVGNCLIEELFLRDCSLDNRLSVLCALNDAAVELSRETFEGSPLFPFSRDRLPFHSQVQPPNMELVSSTTTNGLRRQSGSWDSSTISEVLPTWFYLILKNFVDTADNESIWGEENGALLLSKIIGTLSCIVYCVGNYAPAIDLIAMDLYRLAWGFKDGETPDVRAAAIQAVGVVIQVASRHLRLNLLSDESENGPLRTLSRLLESDPDERCRDIAHANIHAFSKAASIERDTEQIGSIL